MLIFFFKEEKGKKQRQEEKEKTERCRVSQGPRRWAGCGAALRHGVLGALCPAGGSVADTSHPCHQAIPASPVSAQMGRWEKFLFDEASEGW